MSQEVKEFVTKEEKERANNVNLVEYLLSIGEPLKKEGNQFYRHEQHDSLVINNKRNYFSWNSKNVSGNAVTYLMNVHNLTFQHAVKKINSDLGDKDFVAFKAPEPTYPDTFQYEVEEVKTTDHIMKYLVNDRKIDADLVEMLVDMDYIKEDSYKNVVFKWKENGELIGASLQGTREIPEEKRLHEDRAYFKKVLPTTKEATNDGFSITRGYPENLYFFEAPIDALSYLTLNRTTLSNCQLKSMDGLKLETFVQTVRKAVKELEKTGKQIESITLCVDNDSAGREFIEKIKAYDFQRKDGKKISIESDIPDLPKGQLKWDWNNELKQRKQSPIKKKLSNEIEL